MGAFGILGVSPPLPSLVEGFGLTRLDVAFVVPSVYMLVAGAHARVAAREEAREAAVAGGVPDVA